MATKPIKLLWSMLLLSLITLMSGCSINGYQSTLDPSGPVAEMQKDVFMVIVWVSCGIFAVVGSLLAYCIMRFRHKGDITADTPMPDQGHGNPMLEVFLILVSVGLVGVITVPTLQGIWMMHDLPEEEDSVIINVTGYQWWWSFEYPKYGVVTANEFAIPADTPVRFRLRTADVIHSFWIPRLGGKLDLMPGQENELWLQADGDIALGETLENGKISSGVLYGQCAEFCGEVHALMRFRTWVLNDKDFEDWIEHQRSDSFEPMTQAQKDGKKAFIKNKCASCHTIKGVPQATGLLGPNLTHVASRTTLAAGIMENNKENLTEWIKHPNEVKPGNLMWRDGYLSDTHNGVVGMGIGELKDEDLKNIVEYLSSLK